MVTENCKGIFKKLQTQQITGKKGNCEDTSKQRSSSQINTSNQKRTRTPAKDQVKTPSSPKCSRIFNTVYINARSLSNKVDALAVLLKDENYDFTFITETWLKPRHLTSAIIDNSEFSMYRSDRTDKTGGGVAIIVKKHLTDNIVLVSTDEDHNGYELIVIDYHLDSRVFSRFACVYLPPISSGNDVIVKDLVQTLKKYVPKSNYNSSFHILGDFNFPHADWFKSSSNDSRTRSCFKIVKDFLDRFNLSQLLTSPTHIDGKTLDLFITSKPSDVLGVKIKEPFTLTGDHFMINIKLNVFHKSRTVKSNGYNFYRANFTDINNFLISQSWNDILTSSNDINRVYSTFIDLLLQSINKFVPKRRSKGKAPTLPKEVKKILKEKKTVYKAMKSNPSLKERYKVLDKAYRSSMLNFRMRHEEKIMKSGDKKLFYSYVKKQLKDSPQLPPLLDQNGNILLDPEEKASYFNSVFCRTFSKDDDPNLPRLEEFNFPFDKMPEIVITPEDVTAAITKLKNTVSRTPESIPSMFFKKTSKSLAVPLSILFNLSLRAERVPDTWREAIVVPIFKKGRKNDPSNYRPVSLTSVLCRLLESILHKKITLHLLQNSLLSSVQHGFLSGRSTATQQLSFMNELTKLHKNKTDCDAIYLDFSKAFDKISHHKLIHVLRHYKINRMVINWIQSFLNQRSQRTIVGTEFSAPGKITSGVPQGSVLGPLFFLLYVESLLRSIKNSCSGVFVYAFADDVKLLGSNPSGLHHALKIVEAWSKNWNLSIQPKKSEHISFYNLRNNNYPPTFFISNVQIPQVENVKDLGLIINNKLKWEPYISKITSRAHNISYNILRSFINTDPNFYLQLYKSHVRPILEYNTIIWSPSPSQVSDIKMAESTQRKFTRRLCQKTNIRFNNYQQRLEILNLDSLEIRRVKFDLIAMFKISHNILDINFNEFFETNLSYSKYNTRGHKQKLQPPKYSGSAIRQNFFSNRVINTWNKLPSDIINSSSIHIFKTKLKDFNIKSIYASKI